MVATQSRRRRRSGPGGSGGASVGSGRVVRARRTT